ncbi:tRNA dihydrouridine synthase DusB [Thiospirillum jenense]|uniref:tRNA-dihydrouridine synthase n=1 Tax=Thiospirillum jenense TaxID=1653858 RepID=A0A839HF65_9GAMM|nr:tRNA dihydrouridine synthase DusB [Thiospirillum jenense]MBB1127301.1 tRNA dihydrouridine synthase DusB [Thiospirillum jenense]
MQTTPLAPLKLGNYLLDVPVLLAPMAGITDQPFRQLCYQFGAALTYSEMVAANPALRTTRTSQERLAYNSELGLQAVQIVGSEPLAMAEMARFCVNQGAQIIDINLGCPVRKVCQLTAGSALLRDETRIGQVFASVTRAVNVPITVKTRTGWSPQQRNLDRIGQLANDYGVALLTVHGRTRACGYATPAEHLSLRLLRQQFTSLPLAANGDITSPQQALAVLNETGANTIMIGRAALGRPWLFAQIRQYLTTGELLPNPSLETMRETIMTHLESLYLFYGEQRGLRIARKHLQWYGCSIPSLAAVCPELLNLTTAAEQQAAVLQALQID